MRLLRSWWKQERAALREQRRRNTLLISAGLLTLVLGVEAGRRIDRAKAGARDRQNQNLEWLQWQAEESRRTSQDWAHWDSSLAFVQGRNPGFPARDMATTSLIEDGGLMAVFGEDGLRMAIAGGLAEDRRSSSSLSQCLRDVEQRRRGMGASHIGVLCRGERLLYVGNIEAISDNNAEVVSKASLAYLVPRRTSQLESTRPRGMGQLQRELLLGPASSGAATEQRELTPTLWSTGGHPARLLEPSADSEMHQELMALTALSLGAGLLALSLRLRWMLSQRQLLLTERQRERLFNQRLRRRERQLEHLLDRLHHDNRDTLNDVFARLLDRRLAEQTDIKVAAQEKLAERVEKVLEASRSLVLLDNLTGLPNRKFFLEHLHGQNEQNRRKHEPLALLFINIDRFKQINETYGYRVGDEVIRHVAHELRQLVGKDAFLARFGGDEFSLILNTTTLAKHDETSIRDFAHTQALELLEAFNRNTRLANGAPGISLSIGITLSEPGGTSTEELVRRSDMAMNIAKTGRHDRVSIFDISRESDSLNNYRLYDALQSDIKHNQDRFNVLFQPIMNTTGAPLKIEALSRWHNPKFSNISPDLFFGIAERYRIIDELGQLILEKTFHAFKELHSKLQRPDLQLSLNISPSQLSQQQFASTLLARLEQQDLSPKAITIEITESAVVEANNEFNRNLQQLRRAGMRLALDDFGTGFSSLRLLMWLKPDELKIDKSFVLAANHDPVACQIVRLLHSLAEQMQLTLVAEGVEEQPVFEFLQEIGLDHFQGHLFWQAQSAEELFRSLRPQPASSAS